MCYEDVKLGRVLKSRVHRTDSNLDIPGNGKRVGFWISADENAVATFDTNIAGSNAVVAFVQNARNDLGNVVSSPPVFVGLHEIGDLLFGAFRLISQTGAGSVTVFETYLDDGPDFKL